MYVYTSYRIIRMANVWYKNDLMAYNQWTVQPLYCDLSQFFAEMIRDRCITMIHFLERNWSKLIKNKNETHLTHASYENIAKTSRKEQISGYHAHSFFLDYCIHMWDHKGYIVPSTCCDKSALRYGNFFATQSIRMRTFFTRRTIYHIPFLGVVCA